MEHGRLMALATCVPAWIVLYALSIGPTAFLCYGIDPDQQGWLWSAWHLFYAPLMIVAHYTGTDDWFLQYLNWFFAPFTP